MFRSREFHYDLKNFIAHSLKWSRWWFILRLTKGQMVLLWLLHTTKSLFVQNCIHKFDNFGLKKLTAVCQYCTIMRAHVLRNQSLLYLLITHGKHFTIHLTAPIWSARLRPFSKIKRTLSQNSFWKFWWASVGRDLRNLRISIKNDSGMESKSFQIVGRCVWNEEGIILKDGKFYFA